MPRPSNCIIVFLDGGTYSENKQVKRFYKSIKNVLYKEEMAQDWPVMEFEPTEWRITTRIWKRNGGKQLDIDFIISKLINIKGSLTGIVIVRATISSMEDPLRLLTNLEIKKEEKEKGVKFLEMENRIE